MRAYGPVNLHPLLFLIALNVTLFVITLFRPDAIYLLGLRPALIAEQPWTITTNIFIHAGFSHILFNMISLFFLGSFLLRAVGERSFLAVYFIGGLAGNILFILLAHPDSVGVGASGAIYALAGALAVMVPKAPVLIFPIPVPMPLWAAITIFFGISFLFPYIAWQAHLGGLLVGLAAGLIFRKRRRLHYF
ncbi:MAG: rhomboid family intramembrane serine protease [Dehalococcoidia bacterium]